MSELEPSQLVEVALDFYAEVPAAGVAEVEGDMLLYQWGLANWRNGEVFYLDITRQFIEADKADDDAFSQLILTAEFAPDDALRSIKTSKKWCHSRSELAEFRDFVLSSSAYRAVQEKIPSRVTLTWTKI